MAGSEGDHPLSQKEHLSPDFLIQNEMYTDGFISCLAWRIATNGRADKAFVHE
jgi:hypothetical protein